MTKCVTDRRSVLVGVGVAALGASGLAASRSRGGHVFTGGYQAEGARGIRELEAGTGTWRAGELVADASNASWIEHHPHLPLAYVVDERRQGSIATFRVQGHRWHRLSTFAAQGDDPCHLTVSRDGAMLAVANYSSGSVVLFRLDPATGMPRAAGSAIVHRGHGPVRERQEGAHAHWVGFSRGGGWLHAVDLGADAIFAHRLDRGGRFTGETVAAHHALPGSGPRHLAHHPHEPIAYLVNELANSVTVLDSRDGRAWPTIASATTLPAGMRGGSQAGAIVVNASGTRLYVSNRGHDSIAVFALGRNGAVAPLQHVPCGGRWPRHMTLLERSGALLVANQRSGDVAVLPIGAGGSLDTRITSVPSPGVAFVDARMVA